MPESLTAAFAAPWLGALEAQGIRPGSVRLTVAYAPGLDLLEGDVPPIFEKWDAERIRLALERAFKVEYKLLSETNWLTELVVQMMA